MGVSIFMGSVDSFSAGGPSSHMAMRVLGHPWGSSGLLLNFRLSSTSTCVDQTPFRRVPSRLRMSSRIAVESTVEEELEASEELFETGSGESEEEDEAAAAATESVGPDVAAAGTGEELLPPLEC